MDGVLDIGTIYDPPFLGLVVDGFLDIFVAITVYSLIALVNGFSDWDEDNYFHTTSY
jgi:hypothetical protein